ncbi:MAG TPA: hypothetical protein VL137_05770 [Polyangiaceae bacterium]|nr:hypothetical protein [Polyangiaceae bacterium]
MILANLSHLDVFLEPLAGGVDDDDIVDRFGDMDLDDPVTVRRIVDQVIVPHIKRYDADAHHKLRGSLGYFLTANDTNFGRILERNLIPFQTPSNPRTLFVEIWQSLFGGSFDTKSDAVTVVDVSDPSELRLRKSLPPIPHRG